MTTCTTCNEEDLDLNGNVYVDGVHDTSARLTSTAQEIPEWMSKAGLFSLLPPMYSCSKRYFPHPKPHRKQMWSWNDVCIEFTNPFPADVKLIGWWASEPFSGVRKAAVAYARFGNSGVLTVRPRVRLHLRPPGTYEVGGAVSRTHVHMVGWNGTTWLYRNVLTLHFAKPPAKPHHRTAVAVMVSVAVLATAVFVMRKK